MHVSKEFESMFHYINIYGQCHHNHVHAPSIVRVNWGLQRVECGEVGTMLDDFKTHRNKPGGLQSCDFYKGCHTTSCTQKTYEKQHTSHLFHVIFAFRISKSSKVHTRKRVKDLKLRISIMLKGQPLGLGLTSFTREMIIICINFLFT